MHHVRHLAELLFCKGENGLGCAGPSFPPEPPEHASYMAPCLGHRTVQSNTPCTSIQDLSSVDEMKAARVWDDT